MADSVYFYTRVDSLGTLLAKTFGQRTAESYVKELLFARHEFERNERRGNRNIRLLKRKVTYREYSIILGQEFKGIVKKKDGTTEKATWRGWPFFRRFSSTGRSRGGKLMITYERYNPFGSLAERTIGYLDKKTRRGLVGLEASFEKRLAGTPGVGLYRVLDDQTFMPNEDEDGLQPSKG